MAAVPMIATDPYHEAHVASGDPRGPYKALLAALAGSDLAALEADVAASLARDGVTFGPDRSRFRVDPVPRLLTVQEWATLCAGLCQRVKALDHFVCDVYGRRRVIREGVVPAAAVSSASYFEPLLERVVHEDRRWITIAGLDVVRCPDGAFRVLEDNVRTPSGIGYALAAREAV
ncbi:MAG: circularly permuted type 2 ATP-grasp protein, partial [Solirubrobacterales bacterium]|nr:circularly permuted type 2 ATP-grasp protein [Solirubrobacterales bacterium]